MANNISITGVKEIDAVLRELPKQVSHSIQQTAHAAAAKPLIEREKQLAPEGPTGNLIDSIGTVRVSLKKATEIGEIKVGPRRRRPYKGHAGHLVEFGTKERKLKGKGKYKQGTSRGVMPSKPFVRPAFSQTKQKVIDGIRTNLTRRLVATMKKTLGSNFVK